MKTVAISLAVSASTTSSQKSVFLSRKN